jgi:hypothetical protein
MLEAHDDTPTWHFVSINSVGQNTVAFNTLRHTRTAPPLRVPSEVFLFLNSFTFSIDVDFDRGCAT